MRDVIPHGSEAWNAARVGKWTASRAAALMAQTQKGKPTADCSRLIAEVALERASGRAVDHFVTAAMRRGTDLEREALDAYVFATGRLLEPGGYLSHPSVPNVGASPDGFVIGEPGLVEAKCPDSPDKHLASHVRDLPGDVGAWLAGRSIASEYVIQAQWQLWCCPDREWNDLVSYDPRCPAHLSSAIVRVEPDPDMHDRFVECVAWAEARVAEIMARLPGEPAIDAVETA